MYKYSFKFFNVLHEGEYVPMKDAIITHEDIDNYLKSRAGNNTE